MTPPEPVLWEQDVFVIDTKKDQTVSEFLKKKGLDGWEFVQIMDKVFGSNGQTYCVFMKRPIGPDYPDQRRNRTRQIQEEARKLAKDMIAGRAPLDSGEFKVTKHG